MSNADQRSAHIGHSAFNQIVDVEPQTPATGSPDGDLSAATSLDDLLKAILGREAASSDDRGRLLEVVEAQVHGIRQELGIPQPAVEMLPPLPPSFSEFVRSRHPDGRGLSVRETEGWVSGCARALSRALASTTWRRRPVLLVLVAGGTVILGFVFGTGSSRSLSVPTGPVLQAAPAAPAAPVALMPEPAPTLASSATSGDSSTPMHAVATSGATFDEHVTSEPVLLSSVAPVYPLSARQAAVVGNVEMDLTIDVWGRVVSAEVTSGPSSLRDAAVAAVLQWQYQPAMANGAPVTSRQRVRMSFE